MTLNVSCGSIFRPLNNRSCGAWSAARAADHDGRGFVTGGQCVATLERRFAVHTSW
jgi:hypothetical protein